MEVHVAVMHAVGETAYLSIKHPMPTNWYTTLIRGLQQMKASRRYHSYPAG